MNTHPNHEEQLRFVTQVSSPERAEAYVRAAELVGDVAVHVLDPSVPEDADRYAQISAATEAANYRLGGNGESDYMPRTPDQIKKEVVEYALQCGMVLVMLEHNQQDLQGFWKQADQIIGSK